MCYHNFVFLPQFWPHMGVLYVQNPFVVQSKKVYDMQISRKLKSKTKIDEEIQVPVNNNFLQVSRLTHNTL